MASTLSIVDTENLQSIFKKVRDRHQITTIEMKKNYKQDIFSCGVFDCMDCENAWSSYFSWVTIDLYLSRIVYRWKMKCKICYIACEPTFSLEQFEEMVEVAVQRYAGKYQGRNAGTNQRRRRRDITFRPHVPELCEKCGYSRHTPCWLGYV